VRVGDELDLVALARPRSTSRPPTSEREHGARGGDLVVAGELTLAGEALLELEVDGLDRLVAAERAVDSPLPWRSRTAASTAASSRLRPRSLQITPVRSIGKP
jgi:hypothetical protein